MEVRRNATRPTKFDFKKPDRWGGSNIEFSGGGAAMDYIGSTYANALDVPISGIPPGPANAGGMNNVTVDPSGIGNASRIAPLPQPRITVPVIPHFK